MAKERSFWSSIPGLLTGLAGALTGVVGLLGLALSQGWIGDGSAEEEEQGGGGGPEVVRISVEPEELSLTEPGRTAGTVTVMNEGNQPVSVTTEVTGEGAAAFTVASGDCTRSEIAEGRTCTLEVTLDATTGRHQARLVVAAGGGEDNREVALSGTSAGLLG